MSEEPPGPRPSHLITLSEVDAWLADSVVKMVTYHDYVVALDADTVKVVGS